MRDTVSLILPILVPSWRFFKTIEPSPRVQWALCPTSEPQPTDWQEFRPRPAVLSPLQMISRLFWNPAWNEALFLVSCAERIQQSPTDHSVNEIRRRVLSDLATRGIDSSGQSLFFRLVFVQRTDAGITQEVLHQSGPLPTSGSRA